MGYVKYIKKNESKINLLNKYSLIDVGFLYGFIKIILYRLSKNNSLKLEQLLNYLSFDDDEKELIREILIPIMPMLNNWIKLGNQDGKKYENQFDYIFTVIVDFLLENQRNFNEPL